MYVADPVMMSDHITHRAGEKQTGFAYKDPKSVKDFHAQVIIGLKDFYFVNLFSSKNAHKPTHSPTPSVFFPKKRARFLRRKRPRPAAYAKTSEAETAPRSLGVERVIILAQRDSGF